eukprot:scaffold3154_cov19-Tisochrysis_lutea.AAC.2
MLLQQRAPSMLTCARAASCIRFVLNDAFTNMRAEERQQLLHLKGVGSSGSLFTVDRDEVRLRRTIGRNKDEYHLDRRHIK